MGYLLGFTLARLEYLSFHGIFCTDSALTSSAAPGECFYYLRNPYKIGMMMHLYTVLPAGLLVVLQFVPAIRYKALILHRINGYLVVILTTLSNASVIIIAPHAFGGDFATRTWIGAMVISTTFAYVFAYINIKKLQIDQHRAWMMRAWAYVRRNEHETRSNDMLIISRSSPASSPSAPSSCPLPKSFRI